MSKRSVVQTFAAHIAHLLNGDGSQDNFIVNVGELYVRLNTRLARRTGNTTILVGAGVVADEFDWKDQDARDAMARIYFERVLERRLFLARNEFTHSAHDLFIALCRRGTHTTWPLATLQRRQGVPTAVGGAPDDFEHVVKALRGLPEDISKGNPAATTRSAVGPLMLGVPGGCGTVAEEMSVWGAITCAPRRLARLKEGEPFNTFCSLVIKAVEAANAHYGTLVALGLSPLQWADLPINTAKQASAFVGEARRRARLAVGDANSLYTWRAVWTDRQVPGYTSADVFWASDLGEAIRGRGHLRLVDWADGLEVADDRVDGEAFLERLSFDRMIELAQQEGIATATDARMLRELYAGTSLAELAKRDYVVTTIGQRPITAHVAGLAQRIRKHAEKCDLGRKGSPNPSR